MKQKIALAVLVTLLLLLLSSCSTMMRGMMKNRMFDHYRSPLSVEQAHEELVAQFDTAEHWTLIDTQDNARIYAEHGDLRPFREIHVCSPATAVRIMQDPDTSYMAAMIPLQIAVYQAADGGSDISVMNTAMMRRMFKDDIVKDEIAAARSELLEILATVE